MPISKLAAGGSLFANAALLALVLSSQNFQFGEDLQETAIELQEAYCFVGTATVVANNGRNM
jgi:putative Mn2+ efflux pump MntP